MAGLVTLIGILLALAGVALSTASLSDETLAVVPGLAAYRSLLILAGIALAAVAGVLILSLAVPLSHRLWRDAGAWISGRPPRHRAYAQTDISAAQLELAYAFIRRQLLQEGVPRVRASSTSFR